MRLLTYSISVVLVAVFLLACHGADNQSPTQTQKAVAAATPYPDGARRITIEELEKLTAEGKAFIVDVRTQDAYNVSHIPNSILIPSGEIVNPLNELPRDKIIVTYCSGHEEHPSAGAVVALKRKGIDNAAALLGGFNLWLQKGKPVVKKT